MPPLSLLERIQNARRSGPVPPGPGTELRKLLEELGVRPNKSCGCKARIRDMDQWGAEGCERNRAKIVHWLNGEAKKATWSRLLTAGLTAAAHGLLINPLNPGDSLLNEALRRAAHP